MKRAVVVVWLVAVWGIAGATDTHTEVGSIAAWNDAFVVEKASWVLEDDTHSARISWSIQQPAGVEQARIEEPYSRAPKVIRRGTAIDETTLATLRGRLAELASRRAPHAEVWTTIVRETGMTELTEAAQCPVGVRVRVGQRRIILWSGTHETDLGAVAVPKSDCGDHYTTDRGNPPTDMRQSCYPDAGGLLVRIRLHHACEGDQYEDRIAWTPLPDR